MRRLIVDHAVVTGNKIEYTYSVEGDWTKYFRTTTPFWIQYEADGEPLDLAGVPQGILMIPFVCNVLPIVWLSDAELCVPELDESFYTSIAEFKKGYIKMYPDAVFAGRITCGQLSNNDRGECNRSAVFYSGGVDSWCTLLRHIEENPDLISLWGADIPYDNETGWKLLRRNLAQGAKQMNLGFITVRTTFRKVIEESVLTRDYEPVLHDGWWHGAQHGIAIIGHAAPCNYIRGVGRQYIASTYVDTTVSCASHPDIDNYVRMGQCDVFHDAVWSRSDKMKHIVDYCQKNNVEIDLHVCWENSDGNNCCNCEKCYRTIMNIVTVGDIAQHYGFEKEKFTFKKIAKFAREQYSFDEHKAALWKDTQREFLKNEELLKEKDYYHQIKWIGSFDFDKSDSYWKRRVNRGLYKVRCALWPIYRRPLAWVRKVLAK